MTLDHISLDPEAAWREQRAEVVRRIEAADDNLRSALDALTALDDLHGRRVAQSRPVVECRTLTLEETARAIGVGMTSLHGLLRSGELPSFMVGSRRKVRVEHVEAWLEHQAPTTQAAS